MLQQNLHEECIEKMLIDQILPEYATDDDWMGLLQDISNYTSDDDDMREMYESCSNIQSNIIDLEIKMNLGEEKVLKFTICPKCNVEGKINDGSVYCVSCGLETIVVDDTNKFSFTVDKDHNTSDNSFMSFNFIGKNSYCYQRSFLKISL